MGPSFASRYLKSTQRALSLLDQCLCMSQLKQIQGHLSVSGTLFDPYAAGKIINFCAISDNGDICHAHDLFLRLPRRTTYIWNTMIKAFTDKNESLKAMFLYKEMLQGGILPNNYTFSFLIRACSDLFDRLLGLMLHGQVVKLGWECYDFVQNGLVHLYATFNCMDSARRLFDASKERDVITWTAVINGYVKSSQVTIARQLFDEMPEKNAVSWSAMINGYVESGLYKEALELFNDMMVAGFLPNHAGVVGALSACAFLGALDQGRWIHAYVDRSKMELDRVLGTALVDMYAKCGCIDTASTVFNAMPYRDVFAFTSLISGLANHGESVSAIKLLRRMEDEGICPNEVTFICVLNACSRVGAVDEGLMIFGSMTDCYGIKPGPQHYGCLVDLLGRAGMLEEAKKVVSEMPMEPDSYVLGALLNACRVHDDVELGKVTVESLVHQSLDHRGVHVLLSNIFASANKWDDVATVRKGMEEKRLLKVPGCSLIEVNGAVYEFVAGHRSHPLMGNIILSLIGIDKHSKSFGFDDDDDNLTIEDHGCCSSSKMN